MTAVGKRVYGIFSFFRRYALFSGILVGMLVFLAAHRTLKYTSTNTFCDACHTHPHVTESWKLSTHYKNESGVIINCVECHLPPEGLPYLFEKTRLGVRDAFATIFKDISKIDWDEKSKLSHAVTYTFDVSCTDCHAELFSVNLSEKGTDAHVYYFHKKGEVRCINCHLNVGHFSEVAAEEVRLAETAVEKWSSTLPPRPVKPDAFMDYKEKIPGTDVIFEMVAVPGGEFEMGSPESEFNHQKDESPVRRVRISPFWMGRAEVSWDEWECYYEKTATMGKYASIEEGSVAVDATTGPTPPYGSPDQGWGRSTRPAITMTHHAAVKYCEWLSSVTGVDYRLPTEAEWEYACRGNTKNPYFFEADPARLTRRRWLNRITGTDTTIIQRFVWYEMNSWGKTYSARTRQANPFGLLNMLGNVREFCLDWYAPDAYSMSAGDEIADPSGPASGAERVIRGGSYKSDAGDLRSASRDHTDHDNWMLTDPQSPKSIWWYSDCFDVGFRVVRPFRVK